MVHHDRRIALPSTLFRIRHVGIIGLVLWLLAAGAGSHAQEATEGPHDTANAAEINALIQELDDPEQRDALIAKLRLLQQSLDKQPEPESTKPQSMVDQQIDRLANNALALGKWIGRLPNLAAWLRYQAENEQRRMFWASLGWQLLTTLGPALLLGVLVRAALDRRDPGPDSRFVHFAGFILARELLSLATLAIALGLALFWSASSAVLIPLIGRIILAILGFRLLKVMAKLLFTPGHSRARTIPLSEPVAVLCDRWFGRAAFLVTLVLALHLLSGDLQMRPIVADVFKQIINIILVVTVSMASFACFPAIADDLASDDRAKLRRWIGVRLPWIVTATAIIAHIIWSLGFPGGAAFLLQAIGGSLITLILVLILLRLTRSIWRDDPSQTSPSDDGLADNGLADDGLADDGLADDDARQTGLKNRYQAMMPVLVRGLIYLAGLAALLEVWNVGVLTWLWSDEGRAVAQVVVRIMIVAAITLGLAELVSYWARRYMQATDGLGQPRYSNRYRTLAAFFRNIILFALAVFTIIFVLGQAGVDATALLAGAGVIGLAIGFGSQKLVQDLINGLFILLGDTFSVGDVVDIGGLGGVVEAMSMRTVTLRSYDGNVHTIPYSSIDAITNMTKDYSYADFNIGVGYGADIDQVDQTLRAVFDEMKRDQEFRRLILDDIEIAGVNELGDNAVVFKGRIMTTPGYQWAVRREFTRRIKLTFDALGIEIPFPQRTIHITQSAAQPLNDPGAAQT